MKYFVILLILIGFVIPQAFGSESFYGTSSFESVPSEISRHFPSTFEIKFQYTAGPWSLSDLVPVIEISPENTSSQVHLDFEPTGVQKNSIARIPVTITVDPTMEYEKIFLSISFEGNGSNDVPFKSGWSDSLILYIGPRDEIGFLVESKVTEYLSPLKQIKAGVPIHLIQCNDDKILIHKIKTLSPACVFSDSDSTLIFERHWAKMRIGMPATEITQEKMCNWYPDVELVQMSCNVSEKNEN